MEKLATTFLDPFDSQIAAEHIRSFQEWAHANQSEEYDAEVQSLVEEFEEWVNSVPSQSQTEIPFGMQFQGWPIAVEAPRLSPEHELIDDSLDRSKLGVYATLRIGGSTVDTPSTTARTTTFLWGIIPIDRECTTDVKFD